MREILRNPAPAVAAGTAWTTKKADTLAKLKAEGFVKADATEFLPPCSSPSKAPQPFLSAPGGGYASHHAYPGGLVTHTALNVKSTIAICDGYDEIYNFKVDKDVAVAGQILHDIHKPWVFQWQKNGASHGSVALAGTGEHHPLSVA